MRFYWKLTSCAGVFVLSVDSESCQSSLVMGLKSVSFEVFGKVQGELDAEVCSIFIQ